MDDDAVLAACDPARVFSIALGGGRSTEDLVAAGRYGYAHSCVTSDNFPVRPLRARGRGLVLLSLGREVTTEAAVAEASLRGLDRPVYEDALHFGATFPDLALDRPVVFLHDPWFGFFGRRDVISLWQNAGRRELGLEDFEGPWAAHWRFAFVRAARESGARADS